MKKYSLINSIYSSLNEAIDSRTLETDKVGDVLPGSIFNYVAGNRGKFQGKVHFVSDLESVEFSTNQQKKTTYNERLQAVKNDPVLANLHQDFKTKDKYSELDSEAKNAIRGASKNQALKTKYAGVKALQSVHPVELTPGFLMDENSPEIDASTITKAIEGGGLYFKVDETDPFRENVILKVGKTADRYNFVVGKFYKKSGNPNQGALAWHETATIKGQALSVIVDVRDLRIAKVVVEGQYYTGEQKNSAKRIYDSFTDAQKASIEDYIAPGEFKTWAAAYSAIHGSVKPKIHTRNGVAAPDDLEKIFDMKDGDAGRGEILAATIFPNFVTIGAAGAAAGIDLVDVINTANYEVKEPNFRSGTKGRSAAAVLVGQILDSLDSLTAIITNMKNHQKATYTAAKVIEWYKTNILVSDDPNAENQRMTSDQIKRFDDYVGQVSGCKKCSDDIWSTSQASIMAAASGDEAKTQLILNDLWISVYDNILDHIKNERDFVTRGEVPRSRTETLEDYFNMLHINEFVSKKAGSNIKSLPLFAGVINNRGAFSMNKLKANIRTEYLKAINPEVAFKGTNIIICTKVGYRVFTPTTLKQAIEAKFNDPNAPGASAGVTQGLLGMDITEMIKAPVIDIPGVPAKVQQSQSTNDSFYRSGKLINETYSMFDGSSKGGTMEDWINWAIGPKR
tara:strand:- start:1799 stop:3838 length:2040 start_codon:yes stop_codon:yes gene_type:complete